MYSEQRFWQVTHNPILKLHIAFTIFANGRAVRKFSHNFYLLDNGPTRPVDLPDPLLCDTNEKFELSVYTLRPYDKLSVFSYLIGSLLMVYDSTYGVLKEQVILFSLSEKRAF